jgi:hypothetical protein
MTTESSSLAAELPRRTEIPFLKKWRSFGIGIGIEIGVENLFVTLTQVRPNGIRILDSFEILRYRERPAAEWSTEYTAFLAKHKVRNLSATVVLPASECISRAVAMPGVPDKELPSAITYQLEGLHPFPEEEATHSFSRLPAPQGDQINLAIARQATIDEYATIFDEAGVAVASFTSPAAATYAALRILQLPPVPHFLAVHEDPTGLLLYGETPTHPLYSVRLEQDSARAIAFVAAQVRLPNDSPVARLAPLLPHAESTIGPASPLSYAASLLAAVPSQALAINLLPVARRTTKSPLRWVPTILLVLTLAAIGLALAYFQEYENRRLLAKLDADLAAIQPSVSRVRTLDSQIASAQAKLDYLRTIADYPRHDLDALRELTRILPMNAYVGRMDLLRESVSLNGEMDQSADLLKILDGSALFANSEFTSSPGRTQTGKEIFQVRAQREYPGQKPPATAAPPQSASPGAFSPVSPMVNPSPVGIFPGAPVTIPNTPPPGGGSLTGGVR